MTDFTADFSLHHLINLRMVCGRRVRVEPSCGTRTGRFGGFGPPSRSRSRPFHPEDRCYECGDRGHYARDCSRFRRGSRRYVSEEQLQLSHLWYFSSFVKSLETLVSKFCKNCNFGSVRLDWSSFLSRFVIMSRSAL